jgi:hypothetical protein
MKFTLTVKALKEIVEAKAKIAEIEKMMGDVRKQRNEQADRYLYKALGKRIDGLYNQKDKLEEKIRNTEDCGISTREQRKMMDESSRFVVVEMEKNLGSLTMKKAGYSETLDSLVAITYMKYSQFMRNVKGCASLAGKRELMKLERLTQDEYDGLIAKGRTDTTSFAGATETKVTKING